MNTKDRRTYLTLRQAAWLLGVPQASVHRLIRVGVLHPTRRRNRLVVPASEVARLMDGAR
jgi:predicted site-specific integrase-resolvase